MDDVYKPNHLGKILIIGGLVALLATFGLGGFMLVRGAAKVYTTIEAEGAHTLTVPNAGEYVLVRDAQIQPNDRGISVSSTDPAVSFTPDEQQRWIVIGEQRYLILGLLDVPEAGDVNVEISADAYPITLRNEPMAMTRRVVTLFAFLLIIPIVTVVIGIVVAIRNTNKRNRFIMNQMV